MNNFEREEYKKLLSDYTKASERILELKKENLELKQIWDKEEWCKGIPLSAESLKSLFNYNEELFNKNLALDKKKMELEKENQELKRYKEKAILYDKACNKDKSANKIIVDLDYLENLQNEERKFGFAIEILTRVANIKTEKHLTRLYEHKYISKEEYELLKEVLG